MSADDDDRELAALAGAPAPAAPPLGPELERALVGLAPAGPRRPLRQLAVLAAASLAYGAGVLAVVTMRRDLGELPALWLGVVGTAWFLGFASALYLATVPARGAVIPRWRAGGTLAAILAIAIIAFYLLADIPAGSSSVQLGWPRFLRGHACLEIGLASALVPVIGGALVLRGALPVGARWAAAALGAAGGCLGVLVLHVHCPVTDHPHLGLIHGAVVVVAAALSAAIVPRRV